MIRAPASGLQNAASRSGCFEDSDRDQGIEALGSRASPAGSVPDHVKISDFRPFQAAGPLAIDRHKCWDGFYGRQRCRS
jgi:hypothetical protein